MRNLKRVLSLALATVMLLGMMVIGAGAADAKKPLTDLDKVTNKEAVTLLVDLGLIGGKPDGSYAPAEIVDRATMAKLITIMMMGDVDQNSFKGATTDLTDIDGNWAEGYIKFCYSNKIISGNGLGKFNPSEPVTTAAAAKMLLVALGYVASDRGYEGASWSLNVMRDAQSTTEAIGSTTVTRSLTKGTSVKANDPLTRDNAAQMIFNTLFVKTQEPIYQWDGGKQYIQKYDSKTSMAATTYNGLVRKAGLMTEYNVATKTATILIAGTPVSPKLAANTADIGSKVAYYVDANAKIISSAASAVAAEVLATSTNGTTWEKLTTRGQKGFIGFDVDATLMLYVNGTKQIDDTFATGSFAAADGIYNTADTTASTGDIIKYNAIGTANDGVGQVIEFIDNDSNGKYDVVKFTSYALTKVTQTAAAKADGSEATITIKGINGGSAIKQSLFVGDFAAMAKDTYVMAAKIGDQFHAYAPTTVTGKMTKYNTSANSMTVDGTVYTAAMLTNHVGFTQAQSFIGSANSVFYIDANGYVVAVDGVATETKYVVVDSAAYVKASGTETTGYAEARLVFTDGTKQIVKVSKFNNAPVVYESTTPAYATAKLSDIASENNTAFTDAIYTYKIDSNDKYELMKVAAPSAVAVAKGNPSVGTATANNATVYVYKTGTATDNKLTAYTGYAAAPTAASTPVAVVTKDGFAKFVYVNAVGKNVGDTVTDVIVFLSGNHTVDNSGKAPLYEYKAAVNGKVGTYVSKNDLTDDTNFAINVPFNVNVDADGRIDLPSSTATVATNYTKTAAKTDATNGIVSLYDVVNTNSALTFNGDEVVYLINDGNVTSGTMTDIKAGYYFYVKTMEVSTTSAKGMAAKEVYVVVPGTATATAPTGLAITGSNLTISQGNLLNASPAVAGAADGETFTVTATPAANTHVTVTVSGKGTTVTSYDDAAADYTLKTADIGANKGVTVTVTVTQEGKAPVTTSYLVAVTA